MANELVTTIHPALDAYLRITYANAAFKSEFENGVATMTAGDIDVPKLTQYWLKLVMRANEINSLKTTNNLNLVAQTVEQNPTKDMVAGINTLLPDLVAIRDEIETLTTDGSGNILGNQYGTTSLPANLLNSTQTATLVSLLQTALTRFV